MRGDIQGKNNVTEASQTEVEFKICASFFITNVSQELMKQ